MSMTVYKIYFNDGSMIDACATSLERACEMACRNSDHELDEITRVYIPCMHAELGDASLKALSTSAIGGSAGSATPDGSKVSGIVSQQKRKVN